MTGQRSCVSFWRSIWFGEIMLHLNYNVKSTVVFYYENQLPLNMRVAIKLVITPKHINSYKCLYG